MAKKSKTRHQSSGNAATHPRANRVSQRWRQKMILGGVILVLVIGIGVFVRSWQASRIPPQLQGAIDNHYTRGPAAAAIVIKEFSDFT